MRIEPLDRDTIEGIAQKAVRDAVDFIESEISEPRLRAQRYFDGAVDIGYERTNPMCFCGESVTICCLADSGQRRSI